MPSFPDSTIATGMVYSATDSNPYFFGDGCIFTNCTFTNPCTFGDGCVFIGCQLLDGRPPYNTQPHRMGKGCVFDKGTQVNFTIAGEGNIWGDGYQVGSRANVIGIGNIITKTSKTSAGSKYQQPKGCPCGALVVNNNGPVYAGPYAVGGELTNKPKD